MNTVFIRKDFFFLFSKIQLTHFNCEKIFIEFIKILFSFLIEIHYKKCRKTFSSISTWKYLKVGYQKTDQIQSTLNRSNKRGRKFNSFKYSYLILIILPNINPLLAHS